MQDRAVVTLGYFDDAAFFAAVIGRHPACIEHLTPARRIKGGLIENDRRALFLSRWRHHVHNFRFEFEKIRGGVVKAMRHWGEAIFNFQFVRLRPSSYSRCSKLQVTTYKFSTVR